MRAIVIKELGGLESLVAESLTDPKLPPLRAERGAVARAPLCAGSGPDVSDPERWADEYGDFLFKFAVGRLRDPVKAEDAVQETFLAALKSRQSFEGRSAERTWLVGILKNKIFDHFRRTCREMSFSDLQFESGDEEDQFIADALAGGAWAWEAVPQERQNHGRNLDNALFWETYQEGVSKLPEKMAAAFHLRIVDEVESKEVCAMLNISEENLWVLLHRARLALRRSLEAGWFVKERCGAARD